MPVDAPALRIGAFARRVGVTADLLRAWERRYGLLEPVRSPGGYRLYGERDAARVARMREGLAAGLSAAEAARGAIASDAQSPGAPRALNGGEPGPVSVPVPGPATSPRAGDPEAAAAAVLDAIRDYDEPAVQARLDEALATFGLETVLDGVILPVLARVGTEWEAGRLEIGHEHFASNVLRGRLLALARLWGRGVGPLAVLACAPGDAHDTSLIAFGLLLRSYGWRILLLGASTPVATLAATAASTSPQLVVLATFTGEGLVGYADDLRRLAAAAPLWLCGPAASAEMCAQLGVARLAGDPISAARRLTAQLQAGGASAGGEV